MSVPARSASGATIRTHRALALSLATVVLSLTACSSGGGDYCDVLTEDPDMALAEETREAGHGLVKHYGDTCL